MLRVTLSYHNMRTGKLITVIEEFVDRVVMSDGWVRLHTSNGCVLECLRANVHTIEIEEMR